MTTRERRLEPRTEFLHGGVCAPIAQSHAGFETLNVHGRERKLHEHVGRVGKHAVDQK